MELICPSCEARYRVPEGSIGSAGRQVTCSNCDHTWRAYPPVVVETSSAAAAPVPGPGPALQPQPDADTALADAAATEPRQREPIARDERARLRRMVEDVQSGHRNEPDETVAAAPMPQRRRRAPAPPAGGEPAGAGAARPTVRQWEPPDRAEPDRERDDEPVQVPLVHGGSRHRPKDADRTHEHDPSRRDPPERRGSGAFLTGFLLVVIIAAAMIAAYALHPQIIERLPATEPMLTDYVATVDGWRVALAEQAGALRGWFDEQVEPEP